MRPDRTGPPWEASAAILAGGGSQRMGVNKCLLDVGGRPLVDHLAGQLRALVREVLIGANDPSPYEATGLRVVADRVPGAGPLMGIASVLAAARYEPVLVVACDIPFVDAGYLGRLLAASRGCDVAMPRHDDGLLEPLLAAWRRSALPAIEAALAAGERRIVAALPELKVRWVRLGRATWLWNLNTVRDVEAWQASRQAPPYPPSSRRFRSR